MRSLKRFISSNGITMCARRAASNPNMDQWGKDARHWQCRFSREGHSLSVFFSQGSAHTSEPSAEDVLDCIASDAASYEDAGGFEDWASELGYDEDSRKDEKIYNVVGTQAGKLKRFLGDEAFASLLWETERE